MNVALLIVLVCVGGAVLRTLASSDLTTLVLGLTGLIITLLSAVVGRALARHLRRFLGTCAAAVVLLVLVVAGGVIVYWVGSGPSAAEVTGMIQSIRDEGRAVESRDMALIEEIFAPNATIADALSGEVWETPALRYTTLFNDATYAEADHFKIQLKWSRRDSVCFTSGSKGSYSESEAPGETQDYYNPPGSDEWVFRKRFLGQWVIASLTFNLQAKGAER